MSYPIVAQFLVERYGFRGAALILAAIHGHAFFGMMVMHPIEWHYKVVKIPIDEEEPCNYRNNNYFIIIHFVLRLV